jgi:hypothetical protein
MFKKRDERAVARSARETDVDREDRDRRGEYARQVTRAVMTLLGAAAAGLLIWFATQIGDDSTGGYWAVYGLLAAAGLTLALSQLLGGWTKWGWPKISTAVFLLGFLPVLIAGGWLLLAHQPEGATFRGTALNWSSDIGLGGLVGDFGGYLPAVALGIGLVFGFTFDTRGPRVRTATVAERRREVESAPVHERADADAPLTAERRTVTSPTPDAEAEAAGGPGGAPASPDGREAVATEQPETRGRDR